MEPICPHCNENDCIDEVLYSNVRYYGNRTFHLPCTHCGKMIQVHAARRVVIIKIIKSDKPKSEADF